MRMFAWLCMRACGRRIMRACMHPCLLLHPPCACVRVHCRLHHHHNDIPMYTHWKAPPDFAWCMCAGLGEPAAFLGAEIRAHSRPLCCYSPGQPGVRARECGRRVRQGCERPAVHWPGGGLGLLLGSRVCLCLCACACGILCGVARCACLGTNTLLACALAGDTAVAKALPTSSRRLNATGSFTCCQFLYPVAWCVKASAAGQQRS